MKTNYSDAQIEKLIQRHYPDAQKLQVLSGGLVSQTYAFESGGRKRIFQCGGKKKAYEKEMYISRQYKDYIPVRVMHGVYENTDGCAYCFSDFIEGGKLFDVPTSKIADLVPSILGFFTQLASIKLPENSGFGRFDDTGLARFGSWREFISSIYNDELCNWGRLDQGKFDMRIIQSAIAALKENIDCIELVQPRLIHGDIGSYNLLSSGTEITGAIDWCLALYGDPLYEAANVLFWNEDKLQPLVSAIKDQYMPDEESNKKLFCYTIRIGLEEVYNTAVLGEIGYDVSWIMNRLNALVSKGL